MAVDFDGDALECAIGVLGVASEPAPCARAGTDDLSAIDAQDSALAFGQGGNHESCLLARYCIPYTSGAILRSCEDVGAVG